MKTQISSILLSLAIAVPGLAFAGKTKLHTWHLSGLNAQNITQVESALSSVKGVKSAKCDVAANSCAVEGGRPGSLSKALKSVPGVTIQKTATAKQK